MQRLTVCRHADRYVPEWSRDMGALLQDKGGEQQLTADLPLSPLGHRQAQELAAHLANQDVTSIICSPYLRLCRAHPRRF
jgi:broad specificity phosphatase PhoE